MLLGDVNGTFRKIKTLTRLLSTNVEWTYGVIIRGMNVFLTDLTHLWKERPPASVSSGEVNSY